MFLVVFELLDLIMDHLNHLVFYLFAVFTVLHFFLRREKPPIEYEVMLRRNLSKKISKCQGHCGKKISQDDILLVRFLGTRKWTDAKSGKETSKYGPMYVHFSSECLKSCDSSNYYGLDDEFDYTKLIVPEDTKLELNEQEKQLFKSLKIKL